MIIRAEYKTLTGVNWNAKVELENKDTFKDRIVIFFQSEKYLLFEATVLSLNRISPQMPNYQPQSDARN